MEKQGRLNNKDILQVILKMVIVKHTIIVQEIYQFKQLFSFAFEILVSYKNFHSQVVFGVLTNCQNAE